MSNDIDTLKTILKAVQEERFATAEILLQTAIVEAQKTVLDSCTLMVMGIGGKSRRVEHE